MSLVEQWAWEALLASDKTDSGAVAQFEAAAQRGLADQPRLRALAALHWLRKVASGSEQLSARAIDELGTLATLVSQHISSGKTMFDEQYSDPSLLEPDVTLGLRIGFNLVLKKLQGLVYPGILEEESPRDAFEQHHCSMWPLAGDYGKKIKDQFHELMTLNTVARREELPNAARILAATEEFTDTKVLEDLKKFVEMATKGLGAVFLQELVKHAGDDDIKGHSIIEQLDERPRKQRRPNSDEGRPCVARHEPVSPEACGRTVAAALQHLGVVRIPARMLQEPMINDASNQQLIESVRAQEAIAGNGLHLNDASAVAGGIAPGTPARHRVATPSSGEPGPSQPRRRRTVECIDTPREVPGPMETPARQPGRRSEPDVTPESASVIAGGRRKIGKWEQEETDHLIRLVRRFGSSNWMQMHKSTEEGDMIHRRSNVDLKDKWRRLLDNNPQLAEEDPRNGNEPGHRGTPAAPQLPPAEQLDEHAPPGDGEAAGDMTLPSGNGAPAAAEAGGTAAIAGAGGDGSGDGEPA